MFSKQAILEAINKGALKISPFTQDQVETAHINLHAKEELRIPAKGFVITQTTEKITLSSKLCGLVEGRASLAKQGISVEQSSTLVEPGTDNALTLEVFNASDNEIRLQSGQEIAKLVILPLIDKI